MTHNHAEVKFNNGVGACLCNGCGLILSYGLDHYDIERYCKDCFDAHLLEAERFCDNNCNWAEHADGCFRKNQKEAYADSASENVRDDKMSANMKHIDMMYAARAVLSNIDYLIDNAHRLGCEEVLHGIEGELETGAYRDLCEFLDDELWESPDTENTEAKPVDLSVLISSGIDCYFSDDPDYWCCTLSAKEKWTSEEITERRIKPRMNYWFSWLNFSAENDWLYVLSDAGFLVEVDEGDEGDCVHAFRITGLRDGYCWPWEVEE